ncbi:hypothetical protein HYV86_02155 [Candidatus Woesearchaeota archaeon]|nr:hypothetical protein [Candidatus Woesearchaeota archaeon]
MEIQKKLLMFILMSVILVSGCIEQKIADDAAASSSNEPGDSDSGQGEIEAMIDDQYPTITTVVSPSNPSLGDAFTLTIKAEDDKGLKHLIWESSNSFSNYVSPGFFECGMLRSCSNSWELITVSEGLHELIVYAVDSSGKETGKTRLEVNVGSAREITKPSCGDNNCDVLESENSCPNDCSEQTIVTTVCGNDVCDTDETSETCYVDCADGSSDDIGSCNSNQDCDDEQICSDGTCVDVECRTSADCSGCRRCSYNSCVKCAQGPYGCSC